MDNKKQSNKTEIKINERRIEKINKEKMELVKKYVKTKKYKLIEIL